MKRHSLYSLLLLIIFFITILTGTEFFQPQEMAAYDWLMRTRPARGVSPEIAVIEISDDTLKSLGRWPLPRNYHAALIKALSESGCRMIVFDILLSEASRADDVLAEEIRNSGRVYFPYAFRLGANKDNKGEIPVSEEILAGLSETLKPFSAGAGHINIFVDSDGKTRRLPLWVRYGNKLWPSLGFLAAAKRKGYPLKKIESRPGAMLLDGNVVIPMDAKGAFWVNYPGAWTKTFQHFSYLDVLKAYAAGQKGADARLDLRVFKDKICFVGLSAAGTSDLRANPFEPVYPMVGAQASVCDSFLRGDFISRPRFLWRATVNSCVFIAAFAVCAYFAPLPAFLFSLLLLFLYCITAWLLFALKGVYLDLFLPLLSIALVYTGVLLHKFFEEAQKRRVLEKELEIAASIQRSFLPPDIRNLGSIQLRAFLNPAKFVGGDFYDIICIDESTYGFFIGDVSGKGVSAALIMAQAISLLRVIARDYRRPSEVLLALNNQLARILKGRFVTGQYLVVREKEYLWEGSSAGHMPMVYFNKARDSIQELLPASGPPLGLMENAFYASIKGEFNSGDKIFMYTDGWTETRNSKGQEFGIKRLKDILFNSRGENPDDILSKLEFYQGLFQGRAPAHDDLTAVLLELRGKIT